MKNIAIFYGGNSYEKEISIITACQVMKNIDEKKYKIFPIFMDGNFKMLENPQNINTYRENYKAKDVAIAGKNIYAKKKNKLKFLANIDCAILCNHGGEGEDGRVEGFLDINNIPYTSANHKASVVGMYKNLTKAYLNENKIKNVKYLYLTKENRANVNLESLSYPCIVKPNSLGSSIGISVAFNKDELHTALDLAFELDSEVIIEKVVTNFKEYNIACIKDGDKVLESQIEEVKKEDNFLSFNEKYISNGENKRIIPANVNKLVEIKIREISKKCYQELNMKGVCRFDFIVDEKSRVYLNEFNTIPGSLGFYLFKGLDFKDLITIMIENAIKEKSDGLKIYSSNILKQYSENVNSLKIHK